MWGLAGWWSKEPSDSTGQEARNSHLGQAGSCGCSHDLVPRGAEPHGDLLLLPVCAPRATPPVLCLSWELSLGKGGRDPGMDVGSRLHHLQPSEAGH